jgi:colanic acid biosynthesis glycosyl transferase WcaI
MPKPSILLIAQACTMTGAATPRLVAELALALEKDGWAVSVMATAVDFEGQSKSIASVLVKPVKAPHTVSGGAMQALRFKAALRKFEGADVIVTTSEPYAALPLLRKAIRKKCRAHMHWVHTLYPDVWPLLGIDPPAPLHRFIRQRLHQLYLDADKIVVVGRCMAKILVQEGLEPSRISVIPNWSPTGLAPGAPVQAAPVQQDAPQIEPSEDKRGEARQTETRQAYFDHTPKFRLLYCGELSRLTPISTFLQVATKLEQEHPDIELVFVGAGAGHDILAQERARLGLNNIRLLPQQPRNRLYDLLQSGDLHIQGLRTEALGLTVPVEVTAAFAVGRPSLFVGPEESDPAKLIRSYNAGDILSPHDPDRLYDAILRYRYDSQIWFEAHRGALKAAEVFDPEESLQAWCNRARSMIKAPTQKTQKPGRRGDASQDANTTQAA